MILMGSSPDAVAQQQLAYDQLYGRANEANARAVSQAQMDQIGLALGQQQNQRQQQQFDQSQNFQAQQNALDRQSRLADVTAQYQFDNVLRNRTETEQDFKDAQKDAMSGALPADLTKLKQLYPHFDEAKLGQLFQIAGSASVARVQQAAALADKNGMPPDPSLLDAAGVPKGSDFEKQAHAIVTTLRQPYEQTFTKSGELADTGTRLQQIAKDQTTPPLPEGSASWWNLPGKIAGWLSPSWVPPSAQVQPGGRAIAPADVQQRMAAFQQAIKSPGSMVAPNPASAGFVSNVPANWAPAFGRTATAQPVAPVATAPPPREPSAQPRVITDRSGKRWIYRGSLPDPTQDKNPSNWQPA